MRRKRIKLSGTELSELCKSAKKIKQNELDISKKPKIQSFYEKKLKLL